MKLKEKFKWINDYLSIELLYLTIAVAAYLIYKYINMDLALQEYVRIHILRAIDPNPNAQQIYRTIIRYNFSFIGLFVFPFTASWIIQGKDVFKNMGLTLGDTKKAAPLFFPALVIMLIAVPLALLIFPAFRAYYPIAGYATSSLKLLAAFEISYFFFFFGWEFFYHSFLVFPFEAKLGKVGAVLLSTLPFVIVHIGKPIPEVLGAFVANVFLCILALETRSFWYGMILHSSVAIFMEFAAIGIGWVTSFPMIGR